ncbi:MAG: diguanylate cyclase (GGDEF)-like protein [Candidatus Promineifilaceae bacterium]|jgi:diguanylate cyclase (GGDEF)-like protein
MNEPPTSHNDFFQQADEPTDAKSVRIQDLERQVFDLMSLVKAGRALHNILEPPHLFEVTLAVVAEKLSAGPLALFMYDETSKDFTLVKTRDLDEFVDDHFVFTVEEGLLWQNILQFEPFGVMSTSGKSLFDVFFRKHRLDRLKSDMWVPLSLKDKLIGLLTIGNRADRQKYDAHDQDFLQQYANTAAASINSCHLFVERLREQENLRRTLRNLSMLYDINRAMTFITDLKELLGFILGQASKVSGAQKGSIMLYDHERDLLEIRVIEGLPDAKVQEQINNGDLPCRTFKPGEGVAGRVFETGEHIIIGSASDNENFVQSSDSYVESIMCIPLKVHGDAIGVINLTNKNDGTEFTKDDVDMLKAISDQAAVAINKAQLWDMATTDGLTGVHIRRYLLSKFSEELLRAERFKHGLSVVMLDVDHFKSVNDTHGHDVGDAVLVKVAEKLQDACRTVDYVGRYGGEEFVLIMVETQKDEAVLGADRLRETIANEPIIDGHPITASFGVATYPEDGDTVEQLIKTADTALYRAKEAGRNRVATSKGPVAASAAKSMPEIDVELLQEQPAAQADDSSAT